MPELNDDKAMTTPSLPPPRFSQLPRLIKKKRVLLVDTSGAKREMRADAMRKLGIDVDCACDIDEARSWWRPDLYNLVLINMEDEFGQRDQFCGHIRSTSPSQNLVFLVGKPAYLADLPSPNAIPSHESGLDPAADKRIDASANSSHTSSMPWGIMAASRRISQVRSVAVARTTAMRNRPTPPRDLEGRDPRRSEISQLAIGLRKEGLL